MRHGAFVADREDTSISMTVLASGSNTFKRDTGGCALRSNVYSCGLLGSRMPITSKAARVGSVGLAAGSARMLVSSKLGADPSHDRRQNFAFVGANSTRFATSA